MQRTSKVLRLGNKNFKPNLFFKFKIMKTKLFLFFVMMSFAFTSCETPKNLDPDAACGCLLQCKNSVKATVRHNLCGIGLWGGYVLELADGTIIQPWTGTTDSIKNFKPAANQSVLISFEEVQKDNRYDHVIRCKALGEYETRISKYAHILCIVDESKKNCTTTATVRSNICGVGLWGALVLELEDGTVYQPWSATDDAIAKLKLSPNQKIKIGFKTVNRDDRYNKQVVCLAIGPYTDKIKAAIDINCITPIGEPIDDKIHTVNAEVVNFDCAATGVWSGIQFKTDQIHLQPWTNIANLKPENFKFETKQKVKITYSQVAYDDKYKEVRLCPTLVALPKAIAIKVHEISILED